MRTGIPVLRSAWLGQATLLSLDTYTVGNMLKDIANFRQNGPRVKGLLDLSRNDPAAFDALGLDAEAFQFYAGDAESVEPLVAQFERDFYPPGVRNKISADMKEAVDGWLKDQAKLVELLSESPDVASFAVPGAPGAGAPAISPYVIAGGVVLVAAVGFIVLKNGFVT